MDSVWISSGSTTIEAMVNPIAAACVGDGLDERFVPDTVYFLDNPGLGETLSEMTEDERVAMYRAWAEYRENLRTRTRPDE